MNKIVLILGCSILSLTSCFNNTNVKQFDSTSADAMSIISENKTEVVLYEDIHYAASHCDRSITFTKPLTETQLKHLSDKKI